MDNANVGLFDFIQVVAKDRATGITVQNCRVLNVQGLKADFHGDVLQTNSAGGSYSQGVSRFLRIDRFTASHNYQGFCIPSEAPEGHCFPEGLYFKNVNMIKNSPGSQDHRSFYSERASTWSSRYAITLENVWTTVQVAPLRDTGSCCIVETMVALIRKRRLYVRPTLVPGTLAHIGRDYITTSSRGEDTYTRDYPQGVILFQRSILAMVLHGD